MCLSLSNSDLCDLLNLPDRGALLDLIDQLDYSFCVCNTSMLLTLRLRSGFDYLNVICYLRGTTAGRKSFWCWVPRYPRSYRQVALMILISSLLCYFVLHNVSIPIIW